MNEKLKGILFGIISAICYGTNPLGALFLYEEGLNTNSIIFYRFFLASILLGLLMVFQKKSFYVTKREIFILAILGVLFGISALALYSSFLYMDAGIACTILFVFPVFVAIILAIFFKEKISLMTAISIFLALVGIALLYKGGDIKLNFIGVMIVLFSALFYAIYIVISNKSSIFMSSIKLTFYVSIFCTLTIFIYSLFDSSKSIELLTTTNMWVYAFMLAIVPTILSLIFLAKAIQIIGSTPTAIVGAFEPLTAVLIGVTIFDEKFTLQISIGISLILISVILIIIGKSMSLEKIFTTIHKVKYTFLRYWRWK
ncbi:DMT family transporter [Aliarcobacter butzleri]